MLVLGGCAQSAIKAGTYSILQKEMSQKLLNGRITALMGGKPNVIATCILKANPVFR